MSLRTRTGSLFGAGGTVAEFAEDIEPLVAGKLIVSGFAAPVAGSPDAGVFGEIACVRVVVSGFGLASGDAATSGTTRVAPHFLQEARRPA